MPEACPITTAQLMYVEVLNELFNYCLQRNMTALVKVSPRFRKQLLDTPNEKSRRDARTNDKQLTSVV
jgi:hypothetical protein